MDTPSLVIVGAPHFFSRTTLRPLGPRVTFTASASWFMPRSRPRLASSSNAIILAAIGPVLPELCAKRADRHPAQASAPDPKTLITQLSRTAQPQGAGHPA